MMKNKTTTWLFALFGLGLLSCSQGSKAILTIVDFTMWSFRAETADFANVLDENKVYASSLVLPPDDPQLCSFPPSLLDENNNTKAVQLSSSVALLVSLGACNMSQKALVAVDIKEKVTDALRYVVFYNNDPNKPDSIMPLHSSDFMFSPPTFSEIGLVSISTSTGALILGRIHQLEEVTGATPELLSKNNHRWHLPMVLERIDDNADDITGRSTGFQSGAQNFYWFRIVLFTLLMISPCCRAGYLWWAGGGRIRLRRNENGRIVGFQYIPAMPYWFTTHGSQDAAPPVMNRLSEDDVLGLPVITFKGTDDDEDSDDDINEVKMSDTADTRNDTDGETHEDQDIVVSSGSADAENEYLNSNTNSELSTNKDNDDEEQPNGDKKDEVHLQTTCVTCSICIDDFETGEKIRLLPRCKHAFHTECILPWLTGRQGCCPLCKKGVLGPIEGEESPSPPIIREEINNTSVEADRNGDSGMHDLIDERTLGENSLSTGNSGERIEIMNVCQPPPPNDPGIVAEMNRSDSDEREANENVEVSMNQERHFGPGER